MKAFPIALLVIETVLSLFLLSPAIAPVLAQTSTASQGEAEQLFVRGLQQFSKRQFAEAIATWTKALRLYREMGNRQGEGIVLYNLGEAYYWSEQYRPAIDAYQQSLAIARLLSNRQAEGTLLYQLGEAYYWLKEYPQAIAFYQQSLILAQQLGDRTLERNALYQLGASYYNRADYDRALQFYQPSLALSKALGDRFRESVTLTHLGLTNYQLHDYDRARQACQAALAIAQEMGEFQLQALILAHLGQIDVALERYESALDSYQQSLAIAQKIGDRLQAADALHQLGFAYYWLNDYAKAIASYQQSLAIARDLKDAYREAMALGELGNVYSYLGNYPQALTFHQQSLAIVQQLGDRTFQGTYLNAIGADYYNLEQLDRSIAIYQQALAIARDTQAYNMEGNALNGLGQAYFAQKEYDRAIQAYQQSLASFQQLSLRNRFNEAATLRNLGLSYSAQGKYDRAIASYQQSLAILKESDELYGKAWSLVGLGIAQFNQKDLPAAEKNLRTGIEILESIRHKLGNQDDLKVSIFETQTLPYAALQLVLIARNQPEAALEIAERGRARAFAELLLARLSPQATQPASLQPLTIAQIREVARATRATLVEYSLLSELHRLYIWVISPTGKVSFRQVNLLTETASLDELVTASRSALGIRGRRSSLEYVAIAPTALRQQSQQRLQQLYQLLIQPIADLLPTHPEERAIFIPQGSLFFVPFPALKDENGTDLLEKHAIMTAPAIQVLDLILQHKNSGHLATAQDSLVVGNPTMPSVALQLGDPPQPLASLPGAEREAIAIAQLLNTEAITGQRATKTAIVRRLPTVKLIHLATHGLLDDLAGMGIPGAIALAPSPGDDGLLRADEIFKLKLKADLVVLSACDTGRGRITGDGVIGLSRALIAAGASNVLVSLWSVPDAPTAELMSAFYRNLKQGTDKAQALRQAMLAIKKDYPNPVDWAAFTLIGGTE